MTPLRISLVIFDWAGTTVDHGCMAPIAAFQKAFKTYQIDLTVAQARGPMGMHKKDHIRTLLAIPEIAEQWQKVHGSSSTEEDVETIYTSFMPLQTEEAEKHTQLVPDLLDCVDQLRARDIKIGTTTGYPRPVAATVIESARKQKYVTDFDVCSDEVSQSRPAPWMVYRNMEALGIYPASTVVKVGDTVPDIREGKNAGVWSIGVTQTGSEVGYPLEDLEAMNATERSACLAQAEQKLFAAGADEVIRTLAELPALIESLDQQIAKGKP